MTLDSSMISLVTKNFVALQEREYVRSFEYNTVDGIEDRNVSRRRVKIEMEQQQFCQDSKRKQRQKIQMRPGAFASVQNFSPTDRSLNPN